MNDAIKKLLEPTKDQPPCGPDISNSPAYDELVAIARGKPEVEIGSVVRPAELPDWRELRKVSGSLLEGSKDLNVAVMYVCSLIKLEGLSGMCDGLQYIRGLLEQYWADLHPRLDPEDHNDPTQRLNILRTLTAARASVSGWLRVIDYIFASEICRPKGQPPITFDQLRAARMKLPGAPDASRLSSAISEAGSEVIAARQQMLNDALEAVKAIDQFLTGTLGAGKTISFEELEKSLQELISLLAGYQSGRVEDADGSAGDVSGVENSASAEVSAMAVRGSIKSRDDVVRVIDTICDYYRQVEPGSPVPYVLRRAQKMVKMNFVETVQELSLATVDSLRPSMGSAVDSPAASPADPPAGSS
jgi:type VI secretion system protein ImpA